MSLYKAMVRFSMPVNGTYYVVEAIPNSNAKVMAVISAYMQNSTKKGNPPQSSAEHDPGENSQSPQRTPEAPHEMLENPNTSVAHTQPDVNSANYTISSLPLWLTRWKIWSDVIVKRHPSG